MTQLVSREPYAPGIVAERDAAIEQLIRLASSKPDFLAPEVQLQEDLFILGTILQPAIEGIARQYPERVVLSRELDEYGSHAYESWMCNNLRHNNALVVSAFVDSRQARLASMSVGLYNEHTVEISDADMTKLDPAERISLDMFTVPYQRRIAMANVYKEQQDCAEQIDEQFVEAYFEGRGGDMLYEHWPLSADACESRAIEADVATYLGEPSAQIYRLFGTIGLSRLNLSQILQGFCYTL